MKFLNHDIITEVARLVGVFGRDSSSFALVSQGCYQALISLLDEWMEYQKGFGLPRSVWISESSNDDSPFNYRAAVVASLKKAAEGDRTRVLMEPERYVDVSDDEVGLALPSDHQTHRMILARIGHLRSEKYAALWTPLMDLLTKKFKVGFLSVLPVARPSSSSGRVIYNTDIGNSFLQSFKSLTSVDLAGLSAVTAIGDNFLFNCSSLTSVDLAGLSSVTSIGDSFLFNCSSLTSVDLAGLGPVTAIGKHFLESCWSLTTVELAGLSSVTALGGRFLQSCSSLTSVDLAGLSSATTIGDNFLYNCRSLTAVDLTSLSSVTTIGKGFLGQCPLTDPAQMAKEALLQRIKHKEPS